MHEESARPGRPRSERARTAVLHAVDDLLLETGYAAMTMKGIAEKAGVGRQTVYRWWSTKAEILFEASVIDAEQELAISPVGISVDDLTAYLEALACFLTDSPAGAAYRALLGEAQHDSSVAELLVSNDMLANSARTVIERAVQDIPPDSIDLATALLVGPTLYWMMSGRDPGQLDARSLAEAFMREVHAK